MTPTLTGEVFVDVGYTTFGEDQDMVSGEEYREVVELVGVDTLRGEDGVDDVIDTP